MTFVHIDWTVNDPAFADIPWHIPPGDSIQFLCGCCLYSIAIDVMRTVSHTVLSCCKFHDAPYRIYQDIAPELIPFNRRKAP